MFLIKLVPSQKHGSHFFVIPLFFEVTKIPAIFALNTSCKRESLGVDTKKSREYIDPNPLIFRGRSLVFRGVRLVHREEYANTPGKELTYHPYQPAFSRKNDVPFAGWWDM